MSIEEFWEEFITQYPEYKGKNFTAFAYWGLSDRLAQMVLDGTKSGSVSSYHAYIFDNDKLPEVGDMYMVLNAKEEPVAITENVKVEIIKFGELNEEYSTRMGEKSFHVWRKVQENYFRSECEAFGIPFNEEYPVVFETFELRFKKEK